MSSVTTGKGAPLSQSDSQHDDQQRAALPPQNSTALAWASQETQIDMPGTFPCGAITLPKRLGGHRVPVRIHFLIVVMPVVSGISVLATRGGASAFFLVLITTGPLLSATVLIHEIGHIFESARHGGTPSHILLWPLGGLAITRHSATSHRENALIAAAGPATHMPMLLLFLALLATTGYLDRGLSTKGLELDSAPGWFAALFIMMMNLNLAMFVFNALVPCFPLDCSTMLVSVLCLRGWPATRVARTVIWSSVFVLVVLLVYGLVAIGMGDGSGFFTLVMAAWLAVQTYKLHGLLVTGGLSQHPLFAGAASAAEPPCPAAPPQASVCASAVLVIAIALATVPT